MEQVCVEMRSELSAPNEVSILLRQGSFCCAGSGAMTGWQRLFVEFRMQRKLALQSALAKLAEFVPMP